MDGKSECSRGYRYPIAIGRLASTGQQRPMRMPCDDEFHLGLQHHTAYGHETERIKSIRVDHLTVSAVAGPSRRLSRAPATR